MGGGARRTVGVKDGMGEIGTLGSWRRMLACVCVCAFVCVL